MAKNVMAEVAKVLGLELEEEFSLGDKARYVLMEDGFFKKIGEKIYYQLDIDNLLNGNWDVVQLPKQILDKKEKEYLSNIIKPFKDQVIAIAKRSANYGEFIDIIIDEGDIGDCGNIYLPYFKPNSMYKGMKVNREYTLGQLEL